VLYSFGGLIIYRSRNETSLGEGCCPDQWSVGGLPLQASTALFNSDYSRLLYSQLIWINMGWGVLNLLPIWRLDGGQLTYIDRLTPSRQEAIRIFSVITAESISLTAFTFKQPYLALFLLISQ